MKRLNALLFLCAFSSIFACNNKTPQGGETPSTAWNQRIDYYGAEALLAKVYLTKAGLSGQLSNDDLTKAALFIFAKTLKQ